MTDQITSLREELSSVKQRHQVELWEQGERFKSSKEKTLQARDTAHKEEVAGLTQEWNIERKVRSLTTVILIILHQYFVSNQNFII